jgi:SAM-dependent methyltransferase
VGGGADRMSADRPSPPLLQAPPGHPADPFGEAMMECWAAGGAPGAAIDVVERDDGYVTALDAARYLAGPGEWPRADRRACEQTTGRVLDVGCGAGRHAAVLSAEGFEVVGTDTSPGAVAVARKRGVDAHLGSAAEPPAGLGSFDTFLLLGTNLALLESRAQAPIVLHSLANLAAPGARILGTCQDPHHTTETEHRKYNDLNLRRGRLPGQLRLRTRYRFAISDWFDYLLMSPQELSDLLVGTPWSLTDTEYAEAGTYFARLDLRKD